MQGDIFARTYAPTRFEALRQRAYPPPQNPTKRYPRIRGISFAHPRYSGGAPECVVTPLTVDEPTLVRVTSIDHANTQHKTTLEIGYRRRGESGSPITNANWFDELVVPFFGPFAYLTDPGLYEICTRLSTSVAAGDFTFALHTFTGLDAIDALLDGRRTHRFISGSIAVGVGTVFNITRSLWPRAKYLRLNNSSAAGNPVTVTLGNGAGFLVIDGGGAAGSSVELGPEQLGKGSITMASGTGAQIQFGLGLW